MLLIVLLAILTIVFGWISYALFDAFENQIVSIVALVLAVASGVCAVIFGTMALAYRIGYKADKISAETRYQGIIHQIETVKYTDDIAKERLYEQIIAWNQDVERGKAISGDLWISWSVSPVYNDLQCIEYPDWEGK
jgi:hypothetical protein